jgi:PAS domain S-box-containing protein
MRADNGLQGIVLVGSYRPGLVLLSIVIAVLASGAALDLTSRLTAARGRARRLWLAGGAFIMGLGIWSMHYTGMLAFALPVSVRYHVPTVALSLLAAVFASGVALFVASREQMGAVPIALGSLIMGAGIAAMHYIGMAAMRFPGTTSWNTLLVALSIVIAVAVSAVALWLAFRHGRADQGAWTWRKVANALVLGAAIPSMHYVGMAAARFTASDAVVDRIGTIGVSVLGSNAIGLGALAVLGIAIVTSILDRRAAHEVGQRVRAEEALRERERQLTDAQALAHVGSWEWDIPANQVSWSAELYRMYGMPEGSPAGYAQWVERIHPDHRERLERLVAQQLVDHAPTEYEWDVVRPNGETRHVLSRNVLVLNGAGTPVRMAGTSLDITERKEAEENAEFLVRQLTAALKEVKTLRGILPICANCKRVRTDQGSWEQLEAYVRERTQAEFSHGVCPECAQKVWGAKG